jgi:carboxymethylenebutenolidase
VSESPLDVSREATMFGTDVAVHTSGDTTFPLYVAVPSGDHSTPAVVLACSIDGVDADLRDIADAFAAAGYIAVAPDLFWRRIPGPLTSGDPRTHSRSEPRMERLKENERDLVHTRAHLGTMRRWNGRAVIMGFCYGGPFAIIGPKRLGFHAGVSCHGSQMLGFIEDVAGVTQPICILWGDQDLLAPEPVQAAFKHAALGMTNLEVQIFSNVEHDFMMPSSSAFDRAARDFTMQRTFAILNDLCQS